MSEFGNESLSWAGELLEARAARESLDDWVGIVGASSVVPVRVIDALKICTQAIERFELSMDSVPSYHNSAHFLDVLISAMHWIESHPDLSVTDRVALIAAALMHDFMHPGDVTQIEGQTVEQASKDEFDKILGESQSLTADEMETIGSLILDTEPSRKNDPGLPVLSKVFNALDIGASFIPWYGIAQTNALLAEQGTSADSVSVYRAFTTDNAGMVRSQCAFVAPWLTISLGLKTCVRDV